MARHEHCHWIRWMVARGVPPGHVAFILDRAEADVSVALNMRRGRVKWEATPERLSAIRRMRSAGMLYREIGEAIGVPERSVWDLHNLPRRGGPCPAPARAPGSGVLRGRAAGRCRRALELGYSPDRVAELLGLEPADVADYAARLEPDGRVRPAPAPALVDEWEYRDQAPIAAGDVGAPLPVIPPPAIAVAELLGLEPAAEVLGDDQGDDQGEEWAPSHHHGPRPSARKLTPELVARLLELRAAGRSIAEASPALGVSAATVKRRMREAAGIIAPPAPVAAEPPPAIAPAEVPVTPPAGSDGWEDPARERMRWVNAKLTFEDAERMRAEARGGPSWAELGERFGVSRETVRAILKGERYTAPPAAEPVPIPLPELPAPPAVPALEVLEPATIEPLPAAEPWTGPIYWNNAVPKLSDEDAARALELRAEGQSWSAIARELGVRIATVQAAIRRLMRSL